MANILVVDDSAFQRKILKDMIEGIGYEVTQAESGKRAIEAIENDSVDLVCLDLLMPEVSGIEVLQHFKDKEGIPPIIVISADIQIKKKEQCMELGASAFINKYIKKDELEAQLHHFLR